MAARSGRGKSKKLPVEAGSGKVVTDENGLAQIRFVPPDGRRLQGLRHAPPTRAATRSSPARSCGSAASNFVNWRQENDNRIQLITDKDEYEVGDTAEILIPSPWQGEA